MADYNKYLEQSSEIGKVESVMGSIVYVSGLPGVRLSEMVVFETGQLGMVVSLKPGEVEVLMLSEVVPWVGIGVARTGSGISVAVGEELLGQAIDAVGKSLENGVAIKNLSEQRLVDAEPLPIYARKKITRQMETGIMIVDLLIPIGRGQRELVLGDRKTGKSLLTVKAAVAQSRLGNVCVYATIGKKKAEIKRIHEYFKKAKVMKNIVLVGSSSQDCPGEIYLTPYTAMAIAEYFRDKGRDVVVVLDDLSTHAKFYREISLVGRRFPGRDSYPGNIFYTHSKLLERAGNFMQAAITCLPVIETTQGDLTGYIQTNLMSMTDGHIYFDADLFAAGRRPAINPFVSVTRVGHQTQSKLVREISQMTIEALADYDKTQVFVRFGAELSDNSRQILALGERLLKFFDQPADLIVPVNIQIVMWAMLWQGLGNEIKIERVCEKYATDTAFRTQINNLLINSDGTKSLFTNLSTISEKLL